jgi:Raf kinase inhibitor-like YbhB/YbcL family protein
MGLNIGVVHWAFPPVTGGVEMHLLTICPEMARQGAKVSVLCGSVAGEPSTDEVKRVTIERRDGKVPERIEGARQAGENVYESSKKMFETLLDEYELNVVQGHNLHLDFFDLSRALHDACDERGAPRYLVIHSDVFIDRSEERTLRIVEEIDWDRLVPISHYIQETMAAQLSTIPSDRWTVIMHGIDIETFRPVSEEQKRELKGGYGFEERPIILNPGRFLPWKGILPAMKSMPRVIGEVSNALMVKTGRGQRIYKDRDELAMHDATIDRYIRESDLRHDVHIGTYDHEDIARLDALSDLVIYTTIGEEPFGLIPVEVMALELTSSAFTSEEMIPDKYTCEGADISPPLSWRHGPEGTRSLALICEDPDAPGGTFIHWVLYGIPADMGELPEDVPDDPQLPWGGAQGRNDFGNVGYGGPCPPSGETHRYYFRLYALDEALDMPPGATRHQLVRRIQEHVLDQAGLMGRFSRG